MEEPEPRRAYEGTDPEYLTTLQPISLRARDLLGLICLHGGGEPPQMPLDLPEVYAEVLAHPDTCLTLTSAFDCRGGPFQFPREDNAFQRRMDLHILQRLMLAPGDSRSARELFRRAAEWITSLDGICVFEHSTEKWPSWPEEAVAAYLRGLQEKLPWPQTDAQRAQVKTESVAEIETGDSLYLRPHHLMCIMCYYGSGHDQVLGHDNLWEPILRMRQDPNIPITFVEGDCQVCPPCTSYDHRSGACITLCGLKDRRKDLDTLQLLDMLPGDRMPAKELFARYVERIPHANPVCYYAEASVPEWRPCGSALNGNYEKGLERIKADLGL
jgi:hypothetical protein